VSGLVALPGLLRRLDAEPDAVLRCAGLLPTALDDPDAMISYPQVGALFGCGALATGIDHIGLLAGLEWRLEHLGIVGQLVRHAETVGDALQSAVLHHWLNGAGGAPFLFREGSRVEIGYVLYATGIPHSDHVYDSALAAWLAMIREFCGAGWTPSEVLLPRSRPANPAPHQRAFGAPVTFDSDYAAMRFPAGKLAERLAGGDPARRVALDDTVTAIGPEPIAPRSHRLVRIMLARGDTHAESLAATLSLSRRTLDRRLEANDLSFQSVLDSVRYEAARQLLEISSIDISAIAGALGYAEPSPFTRAFKRWSGQTPSAWRRSRKPPRRA
jgi:AraC-like DNA-binding protein